MTTRPGLHIEAVLRLQLDLGRNAGLPPDILSGGRSHVPKWHAFDIIEHIRRAIVIARDLVRVAGAPNLLVEAAAWHDVGKVLAPQFRDDGPVFHGHEKVGAAYLEACGGFPIEVICAVRSHGSLRVVGGDQEIGGEPLWIWLELCDELAKWTDGRFPPLGTERTRMARKTLLAKIERCVRGHDWIEIARKAVECEQ